MVYGLGFRVKGLLFRVYGLGFRSSSGYEKFARYRENVRAAPRDDALRRVLRRLSVFYQELSGSGFRV